MAMRFQWPSNSSTTITATTSTRGPSVGTCSAHFSHVSSGAVVKIIDLFVGPGIHQAGEPGPGRCLYLVMNWVDGPTLDDWLGHHTETLPASASRSSRQSPTALRLTPLGRSRPMAFRSSHATSSPETSWSTERYGARRWSTSACFDFSTPTITYPTDPVPSATERRRSRPTAPDRLPTDSPSVRPCSTCSPANRHPCPSTGHTSLLTFRPSLKSPSSPGSLGGCSRARRPKASAGPARPPDGLDRLNHARSTVQRASNAPTVPMAAASNDGSSTPSRRSTRPRRHRGRITVAAIATVVALVAARSRTRSDPIHRHRQPRRRSPSAPGRPPPRPAHAEMR